MDPKESVQTDYILNRDWRGMIRLNARHQLFKLTHGYLLHPTIPLPPTAKVAEIGAGTCIWMIELAEQYPGISIDGFDNALGQGPPASWLSRNVNVILHDVYEPFPSEFIGTYDVVRIQNWLCIWRDATSARLLENIVSLLKPGGFLQWSEQDPTQNAIIRAPDCTTPQAYTEAVLAFLAKPRKDINFEWVSKLPSMLSPWTETVVSERRTACEEMSSNLLKNAKSAEEKERAANFQNDATHASSELMSGVGVHTDIVTSVMRKR